MNMINTIHEFIQSNYEKQTNLIIDAT